MATIREINKQSLMMQQKSQIMMAHIREKIYKIKKKKITNHNGNYQRDKEQSLMMLQKSLILMAL